MLNLHTDGNSAQPIQLDNFSICAKSSQLPNLEGQVDLAGLPNLPGMAMLCSTP